MNPRIVFNRDAAIQQPQEPTWHQIEVSGIENAELGDRTVLQVIDGKALDAIVAAFNRDAAEEGEDFMGTLVDKDHLSHQSSQSTEAMAWLKNVEARDGQLWGLLDWTDVGWKAVRNRRYKRFSTEYAESDLEDLGEDKVRPLRLSGLALTNRPRRKGGQPIFNREGQAASATDKPNHKNTTEKPEMKSIAEKLGLSEDADEAAILEAITGLQTENTELKEAADAAEADTEAEEILNSHKDRIPEGSRDSLKKGLIANRESTEEIIAALPVITPEVKKEPSKRITNRDTAKTPAVERGAHGNDEADKDKADAAKQSEAAAVIKNRDGCSFHNAWEKAKREKPELFASAAN